MKKLILRIVFLGLLAPIYSCTQEKTQTPTQEEQEKPQTPAQDEKAGYEKPYNEEEDAEVGLQKAIEKAQQENKKIIVQAGGNWCIWCLRFHHFVKTNPELNQLVKDNFVYYHLNFSPKNKNEKTFAKLNPEGKKMGYPHFFVLDSNGELLHTQESGIFEKEKSYDLDKVKDFFQTWVK